MKPSRKSAALDRISDQLQRMGSVLPTQKKEIRALLVRLDRVANQIDRSGREIPLTPR